ncbi:MAG: hypothetical protein KKD48_00320 [Nanoarchaeota archaeon]|nr:hypothetical protein [Nanoarchaeota archaeon]
MKKLTKELYRKIMMPVWIIGFVIVMITYFISKSMFWLLIEKPFLKR